MINIEVPKFDFDVTINQLRNIPYGSPGVYLLYGEDGEVWYIGKAADIRSRVSSHFTGTTHTSIYKWNIHRCEAFIEHNRIYRSIYEIYLIDKYSPPLNIGHNTDNFKGSKCLLSKNIGELHPALCQFVLKEGRQCTKAPRHNGFCYIHGGKESNKLNTKSELTKGGILR